MLTGTGFTTFRVFQGYGDRRRPCLRCSAGAVGRGLLPPERGSLRRYTQRWSTQEDSGQRMHAERTSAYSGIADGIGDHADARQRRSGAQHVETKKPQLVGIAL